MRYGAVILAAGIASRMGDFKPLLPMGEESVIQNVVRVLREAGVQQIVVVTGYRKEVLEEHLTACRETRSTYISRPGFRRKAKERVEIRRKESSPSTAIWPAFSDSWQQI